MAPAILPAEVVAGEDQSSLQQAPVRSGGKEAHVQVLANTTTFLVVVETPKNARKCSKML